MIVPINMKKFNLFVAILAICGATLFLNSCEMLVPIEEIEPEPTTDEMLVNVTADLPAAVLSNFDDNSTGAALVKRLPVVTSAIDQNTRLVLVKGSDLTAWDEASFDKMVEVVRRGGYLAIETLTGTQMEAFANRLIERQQAWEQAYIDQHYEIEGGAQDGLSSTSTRWQARVNTINSLATKALDGSVVAEMVGFSNVDYFYLAPFFSKSTIATSSTDENDNLIESGTKEVEVARNAYHSGKLADGVAEWFNRVEKEKKKETKALFPATRAGNSFINELMSASDHFSCLEPVSFRVWDGAIVSQQSRLEIDVYTWGVHDLDSNTDYYYVQEKILLGMGTEDKWQIFYPVPDRNYWYPATNYGEYNRWYGSFLSQFENKMDISGNGTIKLEEAIPYTDNTSGSKAIIIGQSQGTSQSLGGTFSGNFSANPGANLGISYSYGWSEGNSFSMNTQQSYKDLGVAKNAYGKQVTWTYKANKPVYYEETKNKQIYYCHTEPPEILVNDIDLKHEICWSVSNPSGPYTIQITSSTQTAGLLYVNNEQYDNLKHKYEYTGSPVNTTKHTLPEPGRARQMWRMEVLVDEKLPDAPYTARRYIEEDLQNHFSTCYKQEFEVCDQTETSVGVIDAVIKASKEIFDTNIDSLRRYAEDVGVTRYTIYWKCDNQKVRLKEGYTVTVY